MHSKRTHSPPCDKKLNLFGKSLQQQKSSHFRTYINSFINLARSWQRAVYKISGTWSWQRAVYKISGTCECMPWNVLNILIISRHLLLIHSVFHMVLYNKLIWKLEGKKGRSLQTSNWYKPRTGQASD